MSLTVVIGGARSGKSRHALHLAESSGRELVFIATAEALDDEMTERIALHRSERGHHWKTVEAPYDLAKAVCAVEPSEIAVVDCLTLWTSNLLLAGNDAEAEMRELLGGLDGTRELVMVTNEVGQGVVPESALGRRFRDVAGRVNQLACERADSVTWMVAGIPVVIKPARLVS